MVVANGAAAELGREVDGDAAVGVVGEAECVAETQGHWIKVHGVVKDSMLDRCRGTIVPRHSSLHAERRVKPWGTPRNLVI